MHGAGNDYVYINGISQIPPADMSALAVHIADRHFGVGGDGMVVILPSDVADFRMRMFNADGSEAQMCGNASRCVAKYLYDNHLSDKTEITLETLAGIKTLHLHIDSRDDSVESVTVDMGHPVLNP
ncbi:MAG: diaminopimelate epimerase, partial [Muribaculaceae bacterium]|nr:diaminopimelate epimerase [Muribaculaceae bacterium]